MKIAFATSDRTHINAHFGWAKKMDVYEVSTDGYEFLKTISFDGDLKEDGNEDKLLPKIEALQDCTLVYVTAIGGSAASRLLKSHITPLKAQVENEAIADVLNKLIQTLKGSPPPWLRKALQQRSAALTDLDDLDD
jgi:nitrogen fixation protein NifX